jgi:hypothetical protein
MSRYSVRLSLLVHSPSIKLIARALSQHWYIFDSCTKGNNHCQRCVRVWSWVLRRALLFVTPFGDPDVHHHLLRPSLFPVILSLLQAPSRAASMTQYRSLLSSTRRELTLSRDILLCCSIHANLYGIISHSSLYRCHMVLCHGYATIISFNADGLRGTGRRVISKSSM